MQLGFDQQLLHTVLLDFLRCSHASGVFLLRATGSLSGPPFAAQWACMESSNVRLLCLPPAPCCQKSEATAHATQQAVALQGIRHRKPQENLARVPALKKLVVPLHGKSWLVARFVALDVLVRAHPAAGPAGASSLEALAPQRNAKKSDMQDRRQG